MPTSLDISRERRLMTITLQGKVTIADMRGVLREMANHPDFDPDFNSLNDGRNAVFAYSKEEMEAFQADFQRLFHKGKGRSAVLLSTPTETAVGMIVKNGIETVRPMQLFSTMEAALRWLTQEPHAERPRIHGELAS